MENEEKKEEKKTLEAKIYEIMTEGKHLDDFCSCIAAETKNPVCIHLPSRTMIALSDNYRKDLLDDFINGFSMADQEEISATFDQIVKRLKGKETIIDIFPYCRFKQALCGCFQDNRLVAVLACPLPNPISTALVSEVMKTASKAVVPLLRQEGLITEKSAHPMQVYLKKMLSREETTLYQQLGTGNSAIDNTASWRLIWIRPEGEDLSLIKPECEKICSRKEKIWCVEKDGCMVILIDASLENRIEELKNVFKEQATLVISDTFQVLNRTCSIYEQCKTVYEIARYEGSQSTVIFVSEYKSPLYFLYGLSKGDKRDWRNSPLNQITKYDMINGTDYAQTMKAFLLCEMDYKKMADFLHVHKNTIVYRMQRIQELFGLNLKDCHTITNLYLSLFANMMPEK